MLDELDELGSEAQERQEKEGVDGAPAPTPAPTDALPSSSGNYFTYGSSTSGLYTFNMGTGNLSPRT